MIDPGAIPQIPGNLDLVEQHGNTLQATGGGFSTTGSDVHSSWQGLAACYHAPEGGALVAASGLVKSGTQDVGSDLTAIGAALISYAHEVRPLQQKLSSLREDAAAFRTAAEQDDDWRTDGDKVNRHNRLLSDVNGAVSAFMAAQRTCANTINRLYGGTQYVEDNADGTQHANEFGYSADLLGKATKSKGGLPWGKPEERDKPWYEDAVDGYVSYYKGIWVDGVWGTVQGLGNMVGLGGWDAFTESWNNLRKLLVVVQSPYLVVVNQFTDLPTLPKGTLLKTVQETGKGLVAWDTWQDDPARAAGATVFNIGSIVWGTKGAGTGTRIASGALKGTRAGELAAAVSVKVSDVVAQVAGKVKIKLADWLLPRTVVHALDEDFLNALRGTDDAPTVPKGDHDLGIRHGDDGPGPERPIEPRNQPGAPTRPGALRDLDTYDVEVPPGMTRKEWMDELVTDDAQKKFDGHQQREERQVGLTLQENGELPGPIRRDPSGDYEFIDATGKYWDVKTYHPEYPNGFNLTKIEWDMKTRMMPVENRIINTSYMNPQQVAQLRQMIESNGWSGRVKWYP